MGTTERQPLELRTRRVGPWSMNAYALVCPLTGESLLIDPGDEPEVLAEMLAGTNPLGILITHDHPDHVGALETMRLELDIPVMGRCSENTTSLNLDRCLADGDHISIGTHTVMVCATPGHTPDHLCYAIVNDPRILVGDAIFEGGPGKTWSVKAFKTTLTTLQDVILRWPAGRVCYPGHGSRFRLDAIRSAIEGFLAKDHGSFCGDAEWDMVLDRRTT